MTPPSSSRQRSWKRCTPRSGAAEADHDWSAVEVNRTPDRIETIIIGGGQSGLAVGYHLVRQGRPFVILDANERIGDPWRKRWDSLRVFTPARLNGLPGMPFPAPAWSFPTKDEVADYLVAYAARFNLPVRTGVRVDRLSRFGDRFVVTSGSRPTTWWWPAVHTTTPGSRRSHPSSIRRSCSCTRASTEIRPSCGRA